MQDDTPHTSDASSGDENRKDGSRLFELLQLLGLLLGAIGKSGRKIFPDASELVHSGLALGKAFLEWVLYFIKHPFILWTLRLYFGLLPLLAVIALLFGFRATAYALLIAQIALLIFTTFCLAALTRRVKLGFLYHLLIDLSVIEFLFLSALNFFILFPIRLLTPLQIITLIGLLLAAIPLSLIINNRWRYGWAVIYAISALPLLFYLAFPEGKVRSWVGERYAYQGFISVVTTAPLQAFNERGEKLNLIVPAGDTLIVNFSEKIPVMKRFTAFRAHLDSISGSVVYVPLLREVNYYKIHAGDIPERTHNVVQASQHPQDSDESNDPHRRSAETGGHPDSTR
jgi:hypothetical protein